MSCKLHHFSQAHDLCGLNVASSREEASPDLAAARQEVPNGVRIFRKAEITAKRWRDDISREQ